MIGVIHQLQVAGYEITLYGDDLHCTWQRIEDPDPRVLMPLICRLKQDKEAVIAALRLVSPSSVKEGGAGQQDSPAEQGEATYGRSPENTVLTVRPSNLGQKNGPGDSESELAATLNAEQSDTWQEEFDERAGILEFDGGLSREEAERQAWAYTNQRFGKQSTDCEP